MSISNLLSFNNYLTLIIIQFNNYQGTGDNFIITDNPGRNFNPGDTDIPSVMSGHIDI